MPKAKKQETEKVENEESGLEEEIEQAEEIIDNERFVEFLQPSTETTAPVLKKIEMPQEEAPGLEQGVENVLIPREKKDDDKKYATEYIKEDYETVHEEPRIENENILIKQPKTINIETVGRDLRPHVEQSFVINPELQELRQGALERDYVAKTTALNRESKLPFQQEERKYKGKLI